jgi:hypothetical protein
MKKLLEPIRLLELKHDAVDARGMEWNAALQLDGLKEFTRAPCLE